ncbi:hypothetical protein V1525DRAFT_418718 [Lipomyces kononenkoae]|uniref:Uncharacterized protein n=1 Tax=Lipomyces kononenkoae TaxID=34357 RepID=A0ACC3T3H7_LIPKO
MSEMSDMDADGPLSIPGASLSPISAASVSLPEEDQALNNWANEPIEQSDDGPQSEVDDDEIDDRDGGGDDDEEEEDLLDQEYKSSKHREIADFRALLKVLEYNHRASLSEHLVVSARLRAEDERTRPHHGDNYDNNSSGMSGQKPARQLDGIVPQNWTAWPLPSWELPLDNTSTMTKQDLSHEFDFAHDGTASTLDASDAEVGERQDNDQLEEEEYGYERYRLSTHKLFVPPSYSKSLISEISAAGIRCLTRQWKAQARRARSQLNQDHSKQESDDDMDDISNMMYSNDEIERSLLYPHLHVNILQLVNGIMDAMIALRSTQAPEISRGKLRTMKSNDLLNIAALSGMPVLDDVHSSRSWLSVIEKVRKQCEALFQDGQMQRYQILEQLTDRLRTDVEPGRTVVGKRDDRKFRLRKRTESADLAVEDDSEQQSLASSSLSTGRKRKKRRKRKHPSSTHKNSSEAT